MKTIRELLDDKDFDWENGVIIYQHTDDDDPKMANIIGAERICNMDSFSPDASTFKNHPILDVKFDVGYGSPKCPRFVAKDSKKIYFPAEYDGATWCESVFIDIMEYLNWGNTPTPFP